MACNLINVRPGATDCTETFAGTGNKAYIARLTPAQRELLEYEESLPRITFKDADAAAKIEFCEIILKKKVNKIDYQSNPNAGGFTATLTMVVDKNVDSWAVNARTMNNSDDWVVLLSTGNKDEYYFLGDPNFDNEFSDAGTTGDAPDSDKGSTITITAGPLKWEYLKMEGHLSASGDDDNATYHFVNESSAPGDSTEGTVEP